MSAALDLVTEGGTVCPACRAIARRAVDAGPFTLFACRECGSWSSDAAVRGAALSFEPQGYFENDSVDRDKWKALVDGLPEPPGRILDVGCGTGAFLRYVATRFPRARLAGIELDGGRARRARALVPGSQIHLGEAAAVAAGLDGTFDLITLWDVFEHVTDPAGLLTALAARLAPGGAVFVQTIHAQSVVPVLGRATYRLSGGRLRAPVRRTHDAHHLVFFSRRALGRLAAQAGLRVRAQWYGRLARARMDGHALLTATTAAVLALENALGGGLFVSLVLERPRPAMP